MVWEGLKEEQIFLKLKATDRETILRILGDAMIKEEYAEEGYVEALIKREQEFPTGLVIQEIGIAIPHTDARYVKKEGIALAVLKNPVNFYRMGREEEMIKVQLVFMLAIENPESHLNYLQRILGIIRDTDVLKKLMKAKEKKEVIEIIRGKEEFD